VTKWTVYEVSQWQNNMLTQVLVLVVHSAHIVLTCLCEAQFACKYSMPIYYANRHYRNIYIVVFYANVGGCMQYRQQKEKVTQR
jgi:hypothetical protein